MTIFDDEYWEELYQERAAIMEYDGGLNWMDAQDAARAHVEREKMKLQLDDIEPQVTNQEDLF